MGKHRISVCLLSVLSLFLFSCGASNSSKSSDEPALSSPSVSSESSEESVVSSSVDQSFYFVTNGDGTCSVCEFPDVETIVVPGVSPAGDIVTDVYPGFPDRQHVRKIILPNSIKRIRSSAFDGWKMEEIVLPNRLERIENKGFCHCSKLKSVTIPGTVREWGQSTFEGCTALEEVTFSEGLEDIGWDAFRECTSLKSVTFPESLKRIDGGAFDRCSSLASVLLPGSLEQVGGGAFCLCTSLTTLTISDGVYQIGGGAFSFCCLNKVYVPLSVCFTGENVFENSEDPDLVIYCEASEQPEDWYVDWNEYYFYWVVWGAKRSDVE